MKPPFQFWPLKMAPLHFLWSGAVFAIGIGGISGCGAKSESAANNVSATPIATPVATRASTPVAAKPTPAPLIIQTQKSSFPSGPQMMTDAPRPTFIPQPTPKVRPGQTIIISNGVAPPPVIRENPTIIISNAQQ